MDWDDLRFVLAVERTGAYATAALRLGVNESTVARRIKRGEERLGARLFERTAGHLAPTNAGNELVRRAERVELEVQAAEHAVSGVDATVAGTVRVTAVPIVANRLLVPALSGLCSRHSDLRVELIAEPRDLSLTRREADIAVRLARPETDVRVVARRVGHLGYCVYGAVGADALSLPWITYEDRMSDLPQSRWIAERTRGAKGTPPVLVNDAETLLQCVVTGLGKSLLPVVVADRDAGLVRLEGYPDAPRRELWLMVHPDLRALTRVRVVMDWVVETLIQAITPSD